jgi:hypothetical protein
MNLSWIYIEVLLNDSFSPWTTRRMRNSNLIPGRSQCSSAEKWAQMRGRRFLGHLGMVVTMAMTRKSLGRIRRNALATWQKKSLNSRKGSRKPVSICTSDPLTATSPADACL